MKQRCTNMKPKATKRVPKYYEHPVESQPCAGNPPSLGEIFETDMLQPATCVREPDHNYDRVQIGSTQFSYRSGQNRGKFVPRRVELQPRGSSRTLYKINQPCRTSVSNSYSKPSFLLIKALKNGPSAYECSPVPKNCRCLSLL